MTDELLDRDVFDLGKMLLYFKQQMQQLEITAISKIKVQHLTALLYRVKYLLKIDIKLDDNNIDIAGSAAAIKFFGKVLDHAFTSLSYLISNLR